MTTVQEIKLNMYLSIRNFIISNESLTKDLPNFSASYTTLLNTISQIQAIGEMQKTDKTGLAMEKNKLKSTLISTATDYSRKITAFAKFSNNETLLKETKFTSSDLKKMTDVSLKDYLKIIYDKAESIIGSLAEYGITPEKQKVFMETITAYNTSLSMPRTGIAEKSKATKKLTELFEIADGALENMDYAVGIIQLTQTDFFNGYKSSRKRVVTSSRNLALRAKATDNSTGEPVRGVLFTFRLDVGNNIGSKVNGSLTKKTAEQGGFNIKSMPAGTYKVQVSKPGYRETEVTISVADGELCNLEVELEKVNI